MTERADVVLPVAPHRGEGGHVRRLGGPRPRLPGGAGDQRHERPPGAGRARRRDGRAPRAAHDRRGRAEMARSAPGRAQRAAAPRPSPAAEPPSAERGEAVLATWHQLLDEGRLQDGEPYLAGTAPRSRRPAVRGHRRRGRRRSTVTCSRSSTAPAGSRCRSPSPTWPTTWSGCRPTRPAQRVRATLGVDAGRRRHDHQGRCRMSLLAPSRRVVPVPMVDNPTADFSDTPWWLSLVKALLDLRLPAGQHAAGDLVRAPGHRAHAAASRPEPGRPVRPAADPGRRREAGAEGGPHPEERRQGGVRARAGHRRCHGVRVVRDHPARARRSACSATAPRCS